MARQRGIAVLPLVPSSPVGLYDSPPPEDTGNVLPLHPILVSRKCLHTL